MLKAVDDAKILLERREAFADLQDIFPGNIAQEAAGFGQIADLCRVDGFDLRSHVRELQPDRFEQIEHTRLRDAERTVRASDRIEHQSQQNARNRQGGDGDAGEIEQNPR